MYTTLEKYKTWADARGYTYPVDAEIEAAIVIATDFLDSRYTFRGEPQQDDLQVPTNKVTLADIEKAANQATYLQLLGRLVVDPSTIEQAGHVVSATDSLGDLSTSRTYAEGGGYTTTYPTTSIDVLLRKYVVSAGLGRVFRG